MRWGFAGAVIAALVVGGASPSFAGNSAREFLNDYRSVSNAERKMLEIMVMGITQGFLMMDAAHTMVNKVDHMYCLPDGKPTTPEQSISIMESYVVRNPGAANEMLQAVMLTSFIDAFPCKNK